jgi:putative transposase
MSGTTRRMESSFSSLKTDRTARRTRNDAKADVFDYVERRHSTIGYLSPMEFGQNAGLA